MIFFLALKIGKTVPKLFLEFCDSARHTGSTNTPPLFDFASAAIDITVQIPGCGDLCQHEKFKKIIEKHKNNIKKDLCKIRKVLIEDNDTSECDDSGIVESSHSEVSLSSTNSNDFENMETQCPSQFVVQETPMSQQGN